MLVIITEYLLCKFTYGSSLSRTWSVLCEVFETCHRLFQGSQMVLSLVLDFRIMYIF